MSALGRARRRPSAAVRRYFYPCSEQDEVLQGQHFEWLIGHCDPSRCFAGADEEEVLAPAGSGVDLAGRGGHHEVLVRIGWEALGCQVCSNGSSSS